jgi:hypothetical protein
MSDPFREQRFSAKQVRRILERAAALAEDDPGTRAVERTLTREELERAAGELGIPTSAVNAALGHADGDEGEEQVPEAQKTGFIGAPTRILLEREFEGEPDDLQREDLIEDIRGATGETGTVESVGKQLVWRNGYGPKNRDLSVRVRSRDGRTRLTVEERLGRQATGLFVGLGVGGGVGPMAGYIGAVAMLGPVALVIPVVWISLMLLTARTIFGRMASRRQREAAKLMRRLEKSAARWSHPKAKRRVAEEKVAEEEETEREAEAELEADEVARAGATRRG